MIKASGEADMRIQTITCNYIASHPCKDGLHRFLTFLGPPIATLTFGKRTRKTLDDVIEPSKEGLSCH
jgi:hypothetical protein